MRTVVSDTVAVVNGVVREFDEGAGLGVVAGEDGADYPFHCVEIVDGTRTVPVGAAVTFRPLRKFGLVEAGHVRS